MISIQDVAKKAGVAKSTVSKVLNDYRLVSEETREKVERAARELGYVPNQVAVSLPKRQFNRAGLIVDIRHNSQFVDEISMQYLTGAFEKSKEYQLDVVTFFSSQFDGMSAKEISSFFVAQGINCLIIYNLSVENQNLVELIDKKEFCCVLVDSSIVNSRTSSVSIDHFTAQYEVAAKTIAENEFKHTVLYIAGNRGSYITNQRLKAVEKLQKELAFELIVKYGNFNEYSARKIVLEYGKTNEIIVCASDLMAIGAVFALRDMDIFRPVCGFDGISLMGYTQIAMNTVKQDFFMKSKEAFDQLKKLLDGGTGQYVELPYHIRKINYMDVIPV